MKTSIKILSKDSIARNLEKFTFNITSIAYLNEDTNKKSPVSILNEYKILVMITGYGDIFLGNNIHYAKPGDCILFAPGSLYHAEISENKNCQFVSINFSLSTPLDDKNFSDMLGIKDIIIYPSLISDNMMKITYSICEQAINECNGHYYRVNLLLKGILCDIAYSIQKNISKNIVKDATNSEEQLILECHKYILDNYRQSITVEDLCDVCGVSQSYLYKCFKSVLGISTKDFITKTKLDIAVKILLQSNHSVSYIAFETGFNNAYHFSNVFKKTFGVSPSIYRKNNN